MKRYAGSNRIGARWGAVQLSANIVAVVWILFVMDWVKESQFFIGIITLAVIVGVNIVVPFVHLWWRRIYLKHPCNVHFAVWHNDEQHLLEEITLPSNTKCQIEIRIRPRISYEENMFGFGFLGDANDIPIPKGRFSNFVKEGNKYSSPDKDEGHILTEKLRYHIQHSYVRRKHIVVATGFIVETRSVGDYPILITFSSDLRDGGPRQNLVLHVRDYPIRNFKCHNKKHKKCSVPASVGSEQCIRFLELSS